MKFLITLRRPVRTLALYLVCCFPPILLSQGLPSDGSGFPTNLNSWSFEDTSAWTSDRGYAPVSFGNLASSEMGDLGDGFSLFLDSATNSWLQFNLIETNGATNLTVDLGTITFWFSPNWNSASTSDPTGGPGDWGRLIEVGAYTTNAGYGWWSLFLDSGGTNIHFSAQTNSGVGATVTYLSAPISWTSNDWHMVALSYSSTNTALYVDTALLTNGPGITVLPGPDVRSNGFYIGSDNTGMLQARGKFDDIYDFSSQLDAAGITNLYKYFSGLYMINPYNFQAFMASAASIPASVPAPNAITGSGVLTPVSTNTLSCVSSSNVWITNVVINPVTNGMSLTFTIAGGSNTLAYDVFANSVLDFSTNRSRAWAWMGQGYQCVTYSLTFVSNTPIFLILGTPLDEDSDGLTTAFERLVSKTDPLKPDTDNDSLPDSWEVLLRLDPLVNDNAQSAYRWNYTYDFSDWLGGISGASTGAVVLDPEGNVTSVSQ